MNAIEARALWDEHQRLLKAVDDLERRTVKLEAYMKAAKADSLERARLGL